MKSISCCDHIFISRNRQVHVVQESTKLKEPCFAYCSGNICITACSVHVITLWIYLLTVRISRRFPTQYTARYLIILSPRGPSCHYKPVIAPQWKLWDFIDYFVDKLSKGKIKHWDFIFECCVSNIYNSNVPGVLPNLFCSTKCWLNISLLRWGDISFRYAHSLV